MRNLRMPGDIDRRIAACTARGLYELTAFCLPSTRASSSSRLLRPRGKRRPPVKGAMPYTTERVPARIRARPNAAPVPLGRCFGMPPVTDRRIEDLVAMAIRLDPGRGSDLHPRGMYYYAKHDYSLCVGLERAVAVFHRVAPAQYQTTSMPSGVGSGQANSYARATRGRRSPTYTEGDSGSSRPARAAYLPARWLDQSQGDQPRPLRSPISTNSCGLTGRAQALLRGDGNAYRENNRANLNSRDCD